MPASRFRWNADRVKLAEPRYTQRRSTTTSLAWTLACPDLGCPRASGLLLHWRPEELGAVAGHRGHHQAAIKEVVEDLATRLADEQTAVASRPMQVTPCVGIACVVLGTDRIVGAKMAHFQGHLDVVIDRSRGAGQSTEGSMRIGAGRVQQDPVALVLVGVDPFLERGRGIAAFQ